MSDYERLVFWQGTLPLESTRDTKDPHTYRVVARVPALGQLGTVDVSVEYEGRDALNAPCWRDEHSQEKAFTVIREAIHEHLRGYGK